MSDTTKSGVHFLWLPILAFCVMVSQASAAELRFGLTADNKICYTVESGDKLEVLQNFDGRLSFMGDAGKGMQCLLRDGSKTPSGKIRVGGIIVKTVEGQAKAQVKIFVIEDVSKKYISGRTDYIGLGELAKVPCPLQSYQYAITENNELILARPIPVLAAARVLKDFTRGSVLNDKLTANHFMNGKFAMVSGKILPDGRIRLPGKQPATGRPQVARKNGKTKLRTVIPSKGPGIWVTAIGHYGQAKDSDVIVYVLTDTEFARYEKKQTPLRRGEKAPLMLRNLKPGRYHVGVEQLLDPSFIRPRLFKRPAVGDLLAGKPTKTQDPLSDYLDDRPAKRAVEIRVVSDSDSKGKTAYYQMKWYVVEVTESHLVPVVCLLLQKGVPLDKLAGEYPREQQFDITASEELMQTFWRGIGRFGPELTPKQREIITRLLRRGGKVCLPGARTPAIVSVGPVGKPRARFGLGNIKQPGKSDLVTLNEPVIVAESTNRSKPASSLPRFKEELRGTNQVQIVNPNKFSVEVRLRSGNKGANFTVAPERTESVFVGDGCYEVYFVYSNQPKVLYRGESVSLHGSGVRIKLVQVAGGNYSIRKAQ